MKQGWHSTKLQNIFEVKYGKGLPKRSRHSGGSVRVFGSNGRIGIHSSAITSGPTIIIGRKGSVGEVNYSPAECWPIDTTYYVDDFPCDLPPKYWTLYLKSLPLGDKEKSTAIPGINREDLYSLEILVPPLNEQRRIVAKLEKLLQKVDACKERLDKIPTILKRFRQSILAAACSGRLTEDWRKKSPNVEPAAEFLKRIKEERRIAYIRRVEQSKKQKTKKPSKDYEFRIIEENSSTQGWATVKLENLIYIAARIGWRGLKAEEYTKEGPLFLSVHSLNYGEEVDFRDALHISMERYNESQEIMLQENDILLAKDGAGIGKMGIVKSLTTQATVNSSLLVIRSLEAFLAKYLFYFLSGPELQNIAKERITGSATPHLFQKDIKKFILSVPPLEEQHEIVRRVEALFKVADQIEERYKKARVYVDKLTQSILAKAFRGELVPQDPNDEPASELLKRIQEEKDRQTKKREKKAKK